ncbi:hypothetical protein F7734_17650 [Scytonema sp. UIC 10036]|nr:hypothetical protein [Scytonema sp. UIC 10036]
MLKADDANNSQETERINVRAIVAENLQISTGSYSKGKKVFEFISQLREEGKLRSASALQKEFNRSNDAAYKFICDEHRGEVLKVKDFAILLGGLKLGKYTNFRRNNQGNNEVFKFEYFVI